MIVTVEETVALTVRLPYADQGAVAGVLHTFHLQPVSERFEEKVTLTLSVPTEEIDRLCTALRDRTSGRIETDRS